MNKLSRRAIEVLETLIELWRESDSPINALMLQNRMRGDSKNMVYDRLPSLINLGFVERIIYGEKRQELKPLKYPDGRDFLATWNPPPPPPKPAKTKKPIMRVPPARQIIEAERCRLLAESEKTSPWQSCSGNVIPILSDPKKNSGAMRGRP